MPTQTPNMAEILDRVIADRLKESFGGWLPARVTSYNASTNRAGIQVLILDDYEDEEGVRRTEQFPVINDVPVGFVSLGGKFCIRSTVSVGDEGMALFPARPTGKWLNAGGLVDPEDDSHHDFNGAVFLPFRLSAGGTNGDPAIIISATDIQIGGNKNLVTRDEFLGHRHNFAATGAVNPTSGPVNSPSITAPTTGSSVTFPGTQKLKGG